MAGFRIAHNMRPDPTPKARAAKSKDYLAFIRSLPCVITGRTGVEAAHVSFAAPQYGSYGRGKSSKASDRWALPLSPQVHRRQHEMDEAQFWLQAGINPHILALTIHGLWTDLHDDAQPFAAAIINQSLAQRGRLPSRDTI